jgi:hypothetical protein
LFPRVLGKQKYQVMKREIGEIEIKILPEETNKVEWKYNQEESENWQRRQLGLIRNAYVSIMIDLMNFVPNDNISSARRDLLFAPPAFSQTPLEITKIPSLAL